MSRAEGGCRVSHDRGTVTVGNEARLSGLARPGAQQRCDDVIGDFPV